MIKPRGRKHLVICKQCLQLFNTQSPSKKMCTTGDVCKNFPGRLVPAMPYLRDMLENECVKVVFAEDEELALYESVASVAECDRDYQRRNLSPESMHGLV